MADWSSGGDGGVLWRRALYGGVLGSAGVIFGWLLWFVLRTAAELPMVVLLSPLVGAAVGVVYDFFKDYVAAAQEDDEGGKKERTKGKKGRTEEDTFKRRLSSAGKFALGFTVAVALNVTGDQLSAYLRPFFISVVTFLPAGAAFTLGFAVAGDEPELTGKLIRGVLVGVFTTVASVPLLLTPGIGWQADGHFAWGYAWGLLGWWTLLGMLYSLFWGSDTSPQPLAPMGGSALLVVVMMVLSVVSSSSALEHGHFALRGLGYLTKLAMQQPGLPAHAVVDAEKLYLDQLKEKGASKQALAPPTESEWGKALAKKLCPAGELRSAEVSPPRGQLKPLVRSEQQSSSGVRLSQEQLKPLIGTGQPVVMVSTGQPRSAAHETLCRELPKGAGSSLARSWLVVLMFSLGLGLAKAAEAGLRPSRYEGSSLQRRDKQMFHGVLVVLLGALIYIHWP